MVEAFVSELSARKADERCAEVAVREFGALPKGTSLVTVIATGAACASKVKAKASLTTLRDAAETLARDRSFHLLADDRSGAYDAAVSASEDLGDTPSVHRIAGEWAAFLEGEAKAAKTPEARAVFDYHRLLAYLALKEPSRALPMLEETEKDFPADYNAPARIARAELVRGNLDAALRAADRAAARVYGPRGLRVAALRADILEKRGDKRAAAETLERALDKTKNAALPGGYAALVADLTRRADALRR